MIIDVFVTCALCIGSIALSLFIIDQVVTKRK